MAGQPLSPGTMPRPADRGGNRYQDPDPDWVGGGLGLQAVDPWKARLEGSRPPHLLLHCDEGDVGRSLSATRSMTDALTVLAYSVAIVCGVAVYRLIGRGWQRWRDLVLMWVLTFSALALVGVAMDAIAWGLVSGLAIALLFALACGSFRGEYRSPLKRRSTPLRLDITESLR